MPVGQGKPLAKKAPVLRTVNQKGQSQNPLQLPFLFIPLFRPCDLCDFFQLMCDNLIACFDTAQIDAVQPDKFPNNHILLYCCNPNLHPSFEFLSLERKHINRKQLLTAVNRALIQGLNDVCFFAVFLLFLSALKGTIKIGNDIRYACRKEIFPPA